MFRKAMLGLAAAALAVGCFGASTSSAAQNSGGIFKAAISGGSLDSCAPYQWTIPPGGTPTPELQVTGSSTAVGTNKAWLGSTMTVMQLSGGNIYSGTFAGATGNPPANGVYAQQPGTTSPVSVVLNNAAGLYGSGLFGVPGGGHVNATYTLSGTAAGYSFN